ncbi:MAG: hypothetical protein IJQ78_07710 [Selenomonadaceae bacterium]|nr:hypothetical protein [Selenomonadaceae bacterium]
MRILKLTRAERDYYVSQPTAKAMHERIMKDSVYIPEGDRTAAAVYVAGRNAEKAVNRTDQVEISHVGQELSRTEKEQGIAKPKENTPNVEFSSIRRGDTNRFSVSFANSAMVHRAVEQGYIEMDGKQVVLSDDVKKQLIATNKQIQNAKQAVSMHNMLLHEAANARQASDAMKEANDKMSRAMTTASRIMHGRKVSPADEKELMEFNKDLYAMAKSAAALAEHRRKRDDKEDEEISAANDEARAREAEPKDYSVEETPMPQTEVQMDISFDGEVTQVTAVGVGMTSE